MTEKISQKIGRRRKRDFDNLPRRLYVPKTDALASYHLRWVNDLKGRIEMMTTQDDWDFVKRSEVGSDFRVGEVGAENTTRFGDAVCTLVGTSEGKPFYAYLLKKPLEFWEEDRAEYNRRVDESEAQIKRDGGLTKLDNESRNEIKIGRG